MSSSEGRGGQRGKRRALGAVQACSFVDLDYIRLPYTWDNRQHSGDNMKVRLDRGLASATFLSLFRDVKVWHVQTTESDHCYLVLKCSK